MDVPVWVAFVTFLVGVGFGAGWVWRVVMRAWDEYELRQGYERLRDGKP